MNNDEEEISYWTCDMDLAFQNAMIENELREYMDQLERIAAGSAGQTAEEVKVHHDLLLPVEDVCRIESGSIPLTNHIDEARCSSDYSGGGRRKQQQDNLGGKVHHDDLPVENICSIESAGLIPLPNHIDEAKCSSDYSGGGNRKQQANLGRKVHHDNLPVENICSIQTSLIPLPNHIDEAKCLSDSDGGRRKQQQANLGRKVHHDLPVENICSIESALIPLPNHIESAGLIPLPNHINEAKCSSDSDGGRRKQQQANLGRKVHHDLPVENISMIESALIPLPNHIESALIPLPNHIDEAKCSSDSGGGRRKQQQANLGRKKHKRWTDAEHKMFLLGVAKCGRGDWRGISRQYVKMKTPSQVASHAQKYFIRQDRVPSSGKKHRRSIHDTSLEMSTDATTTTNNSNSMINGNSAHQMQPAPTWSALPSMQPALTWSALPSMQPAPTWSALPSMQPAATWSADQPCHSVCISPISVYPHQSQQEEDDDGLLQSVVRSSYSRHNPASYDPTVPSNA